MNNVCDEDNMLITFQRISLLVTSESSATMAPRKGKSKALLGKERRKWI